MELYAHGGWWKDSTGRSGQVADEHARKGPLATVAALANSLGVDGWELKEFASARHNSYYLTFESMADAELEDDDPADDEREASAGRQVAIRLG